MKESVLNITNLLTPKATATPNTPTVNAHVTRLGPAIGTSNRPGYYKHVSEPMAYDTIQTADGRRIRVESHVIGRDC